VWAENEPRYDYAYKTTLDTIIGNYRTTHGIPGMSVVVMHADSVLYQRGFGWADSAQAKRAYSGTVYLTASIAKVVGSTIAARLEARGEIDLSNPTSDYIPDLPDHHTHTVEQLLSKTGCVPHYPEATPRTPDPTRVYAFRTDVLKAETPLGGNLGTATMWADTLLGGCTPGMHYRYSTHGFTYVGAALEEVTGKPIADIIADELTEPFSLPSMRLVTTEDWGGFGGLGVAPHDLAQGYAWSQTQTASLPVDYENTTWKVLGGGLQTDAKDLARFGTLTLNGTIVADTTRLWTPLTAGATAWNSAVNSLTATGLGWVVTARAPAIRVGTTMRNRNSAEHGGDGIGTGTLLRMYRDGGLVIAIMANQQESSTLLAADGTPAGHPVEGLATNIARAIF
jgi:CubicO group peptidase (beta-lactamase class C family)